MTNTVSTFFTSLMTTIELAKTTYSFNKNTENELPRSKLRGSSFMRTLVVGDIHGLHDKLENAGFSGDESLIFLGDYTGQSTINTHNTLNYLVKLKEARPNTIFLRGNHEEDILSGVNKFRESFGIDPWVFEYLETQDAYSYSHNGISMTTKPELLLNSLRISVGKYYYRSFRDSFIRKSKRNSDSISRKMQYDESMKSLLRFIESNVEDEVKYFKRLIKFPQAHREFLRTTTLKHETSKFYFCHSGGEIFWKHFEEKASNKIVISGHYHSKFVGLKKICLALDKGIPILDVDEMTVYDSSGNVIKIKDDWLLKKPTRELVDVFCKKCKDEKRHTVYEQPPEIPSHYVKRNYTCQSCGNSFLK